MFLTDEQIVELTGYTQQSAQIRWLARNGFRFEVNKMHRPKVAVAEVERKMVGRPAPRQPDFEALNG